MLYYFKDLEKEKLILKTNLEAENSKLEACQNVFYFKFQANYQL